MPTPPLPAELDAFLQQPNPAVIASVRPDGSPHSAVTWYLWEGDRVLVNMEDSRKRLDYLRRDPRVSITVLGRGDDWYHQVTLRGRVADFEEEALGDIDRLSRHYLGQDYGTRDRDRVSAWIEVESWYGWEMGRYWTGSD